MNGCEEDLRISPWHDMVLYMSGQWLVVTCYTLHPQNGLWRHSYHVAFEIAWVLGSIKVQTLYPTWSGLHFACPM